jgi:hypothetical protein
MRILLGYLVALAAGAQDFTQRGFLETRFIGYPQTAPGDSGRAIGEALFRYEPSWQISGSLRLAGSFDARSDSHRQVERRWRLDWQDRGLMRPAFSVRRLSMQYHRGGFTAEAGKQFIRWGKADVLNPTDRFAPRDFLGVVDNDFLAVTAARVTYEAHQNTFDLVWAPKFTPSRLPLINQRWVPLPEGAENVPIHDPGARYPGRSQFGVRWNRVASSHEMSLSFYDGFNHLPLLDAQVELAPFRVDLQRFYARMRMYGADAAVPLRWLTVKGEAAYFTSPTPQADEYVQYVVQLERQTGEWFLVGGYAGEAVTRRRSPFDFAPDRGLARSFLGRASYTIDARRSAAFEFAVRENGDGVWIRTEYSHLIGNHWRATAGFTLIRGDRADFLGQYRRNSHALLAIRYSF